MSVYKNIAWTSDFTKEIVSLKKKGISMAGLAGFLKVSYNTVQKRILSIADDIKPNLVIKTESVFEADELRTFIGNPKQAHESFRVLTGLAIPSQTLQPLVGLSLQT